MTSFLERHYKLIIAAILLFMATVSILNAWNDGAIFDETAHIPAAYSYVTKHEIRLNPEHPPLLKDLAGLPLLFLNLNFNTDGQAFWEGTLPGKWDEGQWAAGRYLLYQAGNNADIIIFWSRIPIVILSLLLGWFIFRWVRELAGITAGLFALVLYAFDPNILGHNHFVTTDLGIAAFMAFAFYYYLRFIKFPSWKNVTTAGIFTGLLMITKFSFFTALPIFLLITIIYPLVIRQRPEEEKEIAFKFKKLGEYVGKGAIIFGISLLVVWIAYAANTFNMTKATVSQSIDNNFSPSDTNPKNIYTNKALHFLNDNAITRPLTEFGIGIGYVFRRVDGGNGAYFMQQVSGKAFPAYFPTVFALKEPIVTLFLMMTALILAIFGAIKLWAHNFRFSYFATYIRENIVSLTLFGFIFLYSYISITGNLNIGFRHLFPILPFAFILTAKSIFGHMRNMEKPGSFTWGMGVILLCVFLIAETVSAYPSYMSYFNQIAGGSKNGYKYVTDSNADWGQDIKRLKIFINKHPEIDKIRVNYFGGGDIKYYFGDRAIDWWDSKRPIEPGWYAISVNQLMGSLYDKEKKDAESYRWIVENNIQPVYQVGTSIFIYYVRTTDLH
ncbi:MAG: glycosyltransferase family 39 protein [Parcubacteria group bacterium]|jgi:hypothetical protein